MEVLVVVGGVFHGLLIGAQEDVGRGDVGDAEEEEVEGLVGHGDEGSHLDQELQGVLGGGSVHEDDSRVEERVAVEDEHGVQNLDVGAEEEEEGFGEGGEVLLEKQIDQYRGYDGHYEHVQVKLTHHGSNDLVTGVGNVLQLIFIREDLVILLLVFFIGETNIIIDHNTSCCDLMSLLSCPDKADQIGEYDDDEI